MQFGRVEGHLHWASIISRDFLQLTVVLEAVSEVAVVREDEVAPDPSPARGESLTWLTDQYTQKTIAVDLALEGWEVVGGIEVPSTGGAAIAHSASYAV
ncbi:MAG: hypothetical protein ACRDJH_11890 [Thermomicrobiales bacterium]